MKQRNTVKTAVLGLGVHHPNLQEIVKTFNYALNALILLSVCFYQEKGRKLD